MGSVWGKNIKISLFGESHGSHIGVTIDGLPSGFSIDLNEIKHQLWRRKSIDSAISTPRFEPDEFQIISGFYNNKTTGSPLSAIFKNVNHISDHYRDNLMTPRPGTSDLTAAIRYDFFNDFRGNGHNSARLTLPLVFSGNICYQILKSLFNIVIGSHVFKLFNLQSLPLDKCNIDPCLLHKLSLEYFPVINPNLKSMFIDLIKNAKLNKTTLGGEIEIAAVGLPAGIGSPIFDNLESKIASIIFSIPSVKHIDFGLGITNLNGDQAKDELFFDQNYQIHSKYNHNSGILGGISSGDPIVFRVGFKPIPSIAKPQNTVNIFLKRNVSITINGSHDVSPVVRAAPIVEAALALAILDLIYDIY